MRFHVIAGLAAVTALAYQARANELAHGDDHDRDRPVLLAQAAPAAAAVREIAKIAGELYRFRNNNHYSVFAVTPAGVIATDPIDADAAWDRAAFSRYSVVAP